MPVTPPLEVLDLRFQGNSERTGPLHAQLKEALRSAIDDHFAHGQKFWPERSLVEKLGYSPNTIRRALIDLAQEGVLERQGAKGSFVCKVVDPATTAVGALIAHHQSGTLNSLINELSSACREKDYWFQVQPTHRGEDVAQVLRHLDAGPAIKRFVLAGNPAEATCELWEALTKRGCQVVCVSTPAQGKPAHFVGMDDAKAMKMALEFLQGLGHQRIFYISNEPSNHPQVIQRAESFVRLAQELQLPEAKLFSCETRPWENSGKAVMRVIEQVWNERPTALITTSDDGAWATMSWLSERGVSIPKEVSVMSFDNVYASQFTSPPLTCTSQSSSGLACWAIELLDNPSPEPRHILQEPELVIRRSTGPAPR